MMQYWRIGQGVRVVQERWESMEGEAPAGASPLGLVERRILGVLVEKARTVPDTYPLSLNALVVGCNQKSNRDPLMDLQEIEIQDCLETLIKKKLVARVVGGRVERWRHQLYEVHALDKKEIAIIAELLLRGPQTEGELRQRASRMEPIDDLEILRGVLRGLMERNLVVALAPLERRGAQVTHGFHAPDELEGLRQRAGAAGLEPDVPRAEARSTGGMEDLRQRVASLEQQVAELTSRLDAMTHRAV